MSKYRPESELKTPKLTKLGKANAKAFYERSHLLESQLSQLGGLGGIASVGDLFKPQYLKAGSTADIEEKSPRDKLREKCRRYWHKRQAAKKASEVK